MSEDEKIIDNFKYWFETNTENGVSTFPDFICKKLLDLCQKEKENNKELLKEYNKKLNADWEDAISKDKIRAKIKELEEKSDYWNCDEIEVLKELLEE